MRLILFNVIENKNILINQPKANNHSINSKNLITNPNKILINREI